MPRHGSVEGDPMTSEGRQEVIASRPSARRGWNPVLTVRAMHIVLWLLVISGPVTALLVATQLSSLSERLDLVNIEAGVEMPPDTAGAEGFAELFIATYLGAGEGSTDSLGPFLGNVSLDGVEDESWSATRTTSLGASEVAPGYYAVTVAAEVVAAEVNADGAAHMGSGWHPFLLGWSGRDVNRMGHHRPAGPHAGTRRGHCPGAADRSP